jgi:hypothetical protein
METFGLLGAAVAFFGVGFSMVLYELARIKVNRRILSGNPAADLYYIVYLVMFVLAFIFGLKAIIG